MIPALTTMPAAPATATAPAAIETAMPGFAALLATAAPMVAAQPAPATASATVSAAISVAQGPPPQPVPTPQPDAPSRLETSQRPMARVSLAELPAIAVDVRHLPLLPKAAAHVLVPSLSVRGAATQPSGGPTTQSAAEPMSHQDANAAALSVPSAPTVIRLGAASIVADAAPAPRVALDRTNIGTIDTASSIVAIEALPAAADAPSLSPSLSFAEVAVSAPMAPPAMALPVVSVPATSALVQAEPVTAIRSTLAPQRPATVAPALRGRLPVSAPSLPAAVRAKAVGNGIEPIASAATPSMLLAARQVAQREIMPTVAASVAPPAMAAAPQTVAATPAPAASMSPPPAPVLSSPPALAAPDPASRSFVQAAAPAAALLPAMALASPQPAPTTLPRDAGPPLRTGTAFAPTRLPPDVDDREPLPGMLAIAEPAPMRTPLRAETTVAAASPLLPAVEVSTATTIDLAVESGRLGAVRIGIEGGASDLKLSLGLSPAAAALVAADAPRLIADLAAGGVRLQSLDVSGGGGGQQPPQSHHAPASPRTAALPVAMNPVTARPSTADRYA